MKSLTVLLLALSAFKAQAATPSDLIIACDSINRWNDTRPTQPPLALDEMWSIRIQSANHSAANYFFTMVKTKAGRIVEGPYQVPVEFGYYQTGIASAAISISIPGNCVGGECGRLTANQIALPLSNAPFIMYGWSMRPLTVTSAMEYRCQIHGVSQQH